MPSPINQIIQNISPLHVACINTELPNVEKDLLIIVNNYFGDNWIKKKYTLTNMQQVENVLAEPEAKVMVFIIWTPKISKGKFTIFLNNFSDGWITLLNNYSYNYNKEIVRATFSNEKVDYPVYRFSYLKGTIIRNIQLLKEIDEWEFNIEGEPLIIEDIINYKEKEVVKRMNNDMIENYMKKLGFDCTKKEFWLSNGNAIEYKFRLQ